MADFNDPPRFDLFQLIVLWLNSSMYGHRRGRHYLETNLALLERATDRELTRLIEAEAEDKPEMKQQMYCHRVLLQDVRKRGKTKEAIREVYVNMYGGLSLDIPDWLEEIEQQRVFLQRLRRPERTRKAEVTLLQTAFALMANAPALAPETVAELHNELGAALLQGAYQQTQEARLQALEMAVASYEKALAIYTLERYPLQYAKTKMYLGAAYQQYGLSGQPDEVERAIACYQEAARVYTPDTAHEQWLHLQTSLGAAYLQRVVGDPCDNIEQAIAYERIALQHALTSAAPALWGTIQINLGDAYRQRIVGDHLQSLEQAMVCYRSALQVFTPRLYPVEWAGVHTRLASIFQELALDESERRDKHLRCAIVCYEGALQVYTPDAFLVEQAATLVKLAKVHRIRAQADSQYDLDQAAKCYRTALQVFTSKAFPVEYRETLYSLAEIEQLRQEWLQPGSINPQQHQTEFNNWNNSPIAYHHT